MSLPQVAKKFDSVTGGGGGLVLNLPTVPFGWDISVRHWLYYEAWVVAGILFFVAWMLVRGRTGRAWRAIRDGEIAATASGVSPALYKTLAFGVSSFYAGVAGALLAIEVSYVNPTRSRSRSRSCCSRASSSAGSARCRASSSARS